MPSRLPGRLTRRWRRFVIGHLRKTVWVWYSARSLVVLRRGWGLFAKWGVVVPHAARVPAAFYEFVPLILKDAVMKKLGTKASSSGRFILTDPALARLAPSLYAFLLDTEYDPPDGGGTRLTGSITIWAANGQLSAKLSDKDSGHCCYVAGSSWSELLAAADAVCSDPAGGWKVDPNNGTRPRKK